MSNKNDKKLRNVAKDLYSAVVNEIVNPRLDAIEKFVNERLTTMDNRAKALQGWIVQEVKVKIAGDLHSQNIKLQAFMELAGSMLNAEDFQAKLAGKEQEIQAMLQKEAEDRMAAAMAEKPETASEQSAAPVASE